MKIRIANRLMICLVIGMFCLSVCGIGVVAASSSVQISSVNSSEALYDPYTILVKCYPNTDSKGQVKIASVTRTPAEILADYSNLVPGLQLLKLPEGVTVEDAVAYYNSLPGVEYAQPNYYVSLSATPTDPSYSSQWGLKNSPSAGGISAPAAWDLSTGNSSVIVAVLDTGVDINHPDLAANIWTNSGEIADNGIDDDGNGYIDDVHGWNMVYNCSDPVDYHGHGTHCAGIVGAVTNNGVGIAGTAWDVTIMPVAVLSPAGSGSDAGIIAGIEYAVANGADIISMSLGGSPGDTENPASKEAIDAAGNKGVLCVIAAGNDGNDNDAKKVYPASHTSSNIIAVAASDSSNYLASFSNYGATTVDIAAPGVNIYSTYPETAKDSISITSFSGLGQLGDAWQMWTRGAYIAGAGSSVLYSTQAISKQGSIFDAGFSIMTDLSTLGHVEYVLSKKPFTSYSSISEFEADDTNVYNLIQAYDVSVAGYYEFSFTWKEIYDCLGDGPYYLGVHYNSTSSSDYLIINELAFVSNYRVSTHTYQSLQGTSMATPMVAGSAAVLKSINPSLTPEQIKNIIITTADTNVGNLNGKTVSNGRINLSAAALAARPLYTVTFNTSGGSSVPSQSVYYKDLAVQPSDPTKSGNIFNGWYKDSGCTTAWDFASDIVTADTTIHAGWIKNSYTVTFNTSGGSSVPSQSVTYQGLVVQPSDPTKSGYIFNGWYKDSGCSTAWDFASDIVTADTTIYAGWVKDSYTVTFNTSGGSSVPSQSVTYQGLVVQPSDPTKLGYIFNGWYKDSGCSSAWDFASDIVTANVTIYAGWTTRLYNITYYLDGGVNSPQNPDNYSIESATITLINATKSGYIPTGWHEGSVSGTLITSIPTGTVGDMELYATWTPVVDYLITYYLDGGTNAASNPSTYNYFSGEVTFENPTKSGYLFGGWYNESQYLTHVSSIPAYSTGPVSIYAKWDTKKAVEETVNTSTTWNATSKPDVTYTLAGDDIDTLTVPTITNKKSGKSLLLNDTVVVLRLVNQNWVQVNSSYISIDSSNHVVIDSGAGVSVSDPISVTFVGYNMGDADKDGSVTVNDAVRVAQSLVKIVGLDYRSEYYSDTDGDGTVTVNDAVKVAQYLVNLVDGDYN